MSVRDSAGPVGSPKPDVDQRHQHTLRLGGRSVAEELGEEGLHDWTKAFFGERSKSSLDSHTSMSRRPPSK